MFEKKWSRYVDVKPIRVHPFYQRIQNHDNLSTYNDTNSKMILIMLFGTNIFENSFRGQIEKKCFTFLWDIFLHLYLFYES